MAADREEAADRTIIKEEERKLTSTGFLGRRALLVVLSPNFFGKICVIEKKVTVVGRHTECDLSLPDPLLSRRHCSVTAEAGGDYLLEDLNSTNSTYLNSTVVKGKTRLHYGDRIVLGNTILRFFIEEETGKK
jgi:pSer/pThr/pTyr-binding forkhead associated (FHA) protein